MRSIDVELVRAAALTAGHALLALQGDAKKAKKSRRDFVTTADYRSDTIIRSHLADFSEDLAIYSEEGGGELATKGALAIVDALDGTVNYWYGNRTWAVSIAIVQNGKAALGVIYAPQVERLYVADEHRATKHRVENGEPSVLPLSFHPTNNANLKESRVGTDWRKGDPEEVFRILRILNDNTVLPRILVCCTMPMMHVAEGKLDGYVHPGPMPEDHAAAGLIVQNAGGKVTELDGSPWSPFSKTVVATNGLIHDQLLEVLNR